MKTFKVTMTNTTTDTNVRIKVTNGLINGHVPNGSIETIRRKATVGSTVKYHGNKYVVQEGRLLPLSNIGTGKKTLFINTRKKV